MFFSETLVSNHGQLFPDLQGIRIPSSPLIAEIIQGNWIPLDKFLSIGPELACLRRSKLMTKGQQLSHFQAHHVRRLRQHRFAV